jgi:hypothetical protein
MKLSLFERTITCCLLGAATFAVASGMSKVDPPEDAEHSSPAGVEDDVSPEGIHHDELDSAERGPESNLQRLVEQAVQAIHNRDSNKEEKREELKDALKQIFNKRIESQRARIAAMRERLEAIESQLERRSSLEDQIVERRLSELLGEKDELSWDHEPEIGIAPVGGENSFEFSFPQEFTFPQNFPDYPGNGEVRIQEELLRARANADRGGAIAAEALMREHEARGRDVESVRAARDMARNVPEERRPADRDSKRLRDLESLRGSLEVQRMLLERGKGEEAIEQEVRSRQEKAGAILTLDQAGSDQGFVNLLRQQLEAMRAHSEALEKQLEAVLKKNKDASKHRDE